MDIQLDHLAEWYEERTSNIVQPIRKDAWKIVEELREAISSLEETSSDMTSRVGSLDAESDVAKYAERLARNVSLTLKQVNFPGDIDITHESLQLLYESLLGTINSINATGGRYVLRMPPSFKAVVSVLGYALKSLASNVESLHNFIRTDYVKAKRIEDTRKKIDELIKRDLERGDLLRSIEKTQERVHKIEEETGQKLKSLEELSDDERFKLLTETQTEQKKIDARLRRLFSPLEKPLKKMKKLVDYGDYALGEDKRLVLNDLLTLPLHEVVSIRSYDELKVLLSTVEELISSGRLKLKKRRRERALKCLRQTITRELLDGLRRSNEELHQEKERIKGSLEADRKPYERDKLKKEAQALERKLQSLRHRVIDMKTKHMRLRDRINKQKELVETIIARVVDEKIRILEA